jgi:hypothetical protein
MSLWLCLSERDERLSELGVRERGEEREREIVSIYAHSVEHILHIELKSFE